MEALAGLLKLLGRSGKTCHTFSRGNNFFFHRGNKILVRVSFRMHYISQRFIPYLRCPRRCLPLPRTATGQLNYFAIIKRDNDASLSRVAGVPAPRTRGGAGVNEPGRANNSDRLLHTRRCAQSPKAASIANKKDTKVNFKNF